MVYWFANDPERPQTLAYSPQQHQTHRRYLSARLEEIGRRHAAGSARTLPWAPAALANHRQCGVEDRADARAPF